MKSRAKARARTVTWDCPNRDCPVESNRIYGDGKAPKCIFCGRRMVKIPTPRTDARLCKFLIAKERA